MDNELRRIQMYTCEKIKYYRRVRNYSQSDMADKLWMSKRAYLRLENGETAMTLDRIHQIARILEIPLYNLIGFDIELRSTDVMKEIKTLNQQFILNEKQIIEILRELKDRIP